MSGNREVIYRRLGILALYLLVILLTGARFMADTADYVSSVLAYNSGRNLDFWEFGHLFWRPLGWLLFVALGPLIRAFTGGDSFRGVVSVFLIVNWIAGLVSVYALNGICRKLSDSRWAAGFVTVVFIFSHGFLNYTQTGSAYIPGLALLLTGLYFLTARNDDLERSLKTAIIAGILFGAAVCTWFPYVLSIPAAIALPILFFGINRTRCWLLIVTAAAFAVFTGLAYVTVVVGILRIGTLAGFKVWMSAASHDTDLSGVTRMVFGFARSFIYMGNDGIVFKRYLLKDPFNPVTLVDLFRLSVWKLCLFYGMAAATCFSLLRSDKGRRTLCFLILTGIPVILFAIFFDGGAVERYLPLYPAIFISFAVAICCVKSFPAMKYISMVFGVVLISVNAGAMAKSVLNREQQATLARIGDLQQRIKPQDRILMVSWNDELVNFNRSFPFHPLNRYGNFRVGALVTPGTTSVSDWKKEFAKQALEVWRNDGDLWVSRRILSKKPRAEWNWVEGDERRVSWPDFFTFFSQVGMGESVGGEDGSMLVLPSDANQRFLGEFLKEK